MRFEITGAPARKEIWDYPLIALREAVTNAICHRDYGGGIHRILDDCRTAGLPAPLFENSQGGFRIIFKAGDAEKNGALGGALKQQIIQLISEIPGIQRKAIVEKTGVPERTVDRCIAECIAENKIVRRGGKKTGGYWPLIYSSPV